MIKEFGPGEGTRNYFVIKNIADDNRRNQLAWFMEPIFMLVSRGSV